MALAGTLSPYAYAQDSHEEIIVTGERRVRTVAETPSSVVVFGAEDIERIAGADRIDQLLETIPNVQLGSGAEGPTIRGQDTTGVLRDLPAFLGGTRPRTTLQVDGRAVGYNEFAYGPAALWDLARVEVFRSPQTTTQGRNSIAGAIFVETEDPTSDWHGGARLIEGSEQTRQVSGAVSGPLAGEELAFRLSGDVRRGLSSSEIVSPAIGIDANRDDYSQVRLKIAASPTAVPGLRVVATMASSSSQAPQIEGMRPPFEERRDPLATYGIFTTGVSSVTLRAEQNVSSAVQLRATGSYGRSTIRRFAPPGLGETRIAGRDGSFELISTWKPASWVSAIGGVHWLTNSLDQTIDLTAARLGRGAFSDEQESFGVFGEIEAEPLARVEVAAGGRYQRDIQLRSGELVSGTIRRPLQYDGRFDAFLPKLSVSYRFSPDARVGFLVQKAYNPGGTTLNLASFAADTFDAESLWAYELFARAALLDGRLHGSANLFYYDIDNAQRSLLRQLQTPGGTVTFAETANAPAAWSRGAELQLDWRPSRALSVSGGVGLLDTRLTQALSANDPLLGKEFQRSPHVTASLTATWRPLYNLSLSGVVRHHSSYFSDDTEDVTRRIAPATTVDGRIEWDNGNIELFAYVRNVFDSFNLTYLFSAATLATAGEPRLFGVGITGQF